MTIDPALSSPPDVHVLTPQAAAPSAAPDSEPPPISSAVRRESMAFGLSDRTTADVELFVKAAAITWRLTNLSDELAKTASELVSWARDHGSASVLRVALTWDDPLIHIEVFDRGALSPDPFVSRADAELGVRLLTPPGVEWGAELDSRGRCLWASIRIRQDVAFLGGAEIST